MSSKEVGIEEARKVLGDLVTQITQTNADIILTRRGRPVARLAPLEPTVKHYTAWLVTDASALDGDACDVTVIEDELIGGDPTNESDWASQGPQQFHAVTTVDTDGSHDNAQKEAAELLEAAGWRLAGDWRATDTGYIVTVERA